MKKKPILFIASLIGAFLLAISFIYLQKSDLSLVENTENDQVSGAYEALNFFGARTVYPNQELPEKAFYAAWEHSKKMPKMESN
ncbi:MAG: hypothetical protein P1U70_14400, partial [Saprospiraceae bacterium]|nr:hypothetical protein [Saprospiraceae bacterium]